MLVLRRYPKQDLFIGSDIILQVVNVRTDNRGRVVDLKIIYDYRGVIIRKEVSLYNQMLYKITDEIEIKITDLTKQKTVAISIDAPPYISIWRKELLDSIRNERATNEKEAI